MQAWRLVGDGLTPLSSTEMGIFQSSSIYLVQYCYLKQSPLYTWMEGTVFLWVGTELTGPHRKELVNQALEKVDSVTPTRLVR